jgi:hypothetical protein
MRKLSVIILAALLAPCAALAAEGSVVKALRPELRAFDDKGQPLGPVKASDLKLPTPIVGYGVGNSIGVRQGDRVIYLRGLDVQTDAAKAVCTPVQASARAKGSSYAGTNMGLGGAADCAAAN